jgi:hypothetical protein
VRDDRVPTHNFKLVSFQTTLEGTAGRADTFDESRGDAAIGVNKSWLAGTVF